MAVFFSLLGPTDSERWLCLLQNNTWQWWLVTSESCRKRGLAWGGVGGIMPESNPPAGRLRNLRTYSPLLESLFTNYSLKVVPQKFIRTDSSPLLPHPPSRLSLPKSLTYILPPVVLLLPLESPPLFFSLSRLSAVFWVQSAVTVMSPTSCHRLNTGGSIACAWSTAAIGAHPALPRLLKIYLMLRRFLVILII